jgi:U2 small nuclear ribonucleoprotein B''
LTKLQDFDFYGKRMRTAYSKSKSDAIAKEEGIFVPKHKRKAGEGNTIAPRHPKKSAAGPAPGPAAVSGAAAAAPTADVAAPAAAPVPVLLFL